MIAAQKKKSFDLDKEYKKYHDERWKSNDKDYFDVSEQFYYSEIFDVTWSLKRVTQLIYFMINCQKIQEKNISKKEKNKSLKEMIKQTKQINF